MEHPGLRRNYFACPGAVPAERADRLERLDLFLNGHSRPIACRTAKPENEEDGNGERLIRKAGKQERELQRPDSGSRKEEAGKTQPDLRSECDEMSTIFVTILKRSKETS